MPRGVWTPSRIERYEQTLASSTRAAVVMTDAGRGYVKAMGNPEGLHALVSEFVGSQLAELIDAPTLDFAIVPVVPSEVSIPLDLDSTKPWGSRVHAAAGPAFITRAVVASPWAGDAVDLERLANRADLARLVLLDTWILNRDRYPRRPPDPAATRRPNLDNVLLESVANGKRRSSRFVAMDFTHAFGTRGGELRREYGVALVHDDGIYGLFPEFAPHLRRDVWGDALARLRVLDAERVRTIVGAIPQEWEVDATRRRSLAGFIVDRARYLADNALTNLVREVPSF